MPLISEISLKFGSLPGSAPLSVKPLSVNLFVGPNNAGKSLLLRELNDVLRHNKTGKEERILGKLDLDPGQLGKAAADFAKHCTKQAGDQQSAPHQIFYYKNGEHQPVMEASVKAWIANPTPNADYLKIYAKFNTIKLDGPNRIALVLPKPIGDLTQSPTNRLQQLFQNDESRAELREIIREALGLYIVLDPTKVGHLRVRLSNTAPATILQEKGIHPDAVDFHSKALLIEEASDGMKAFCGILIELFAGNPEILLVDEPEAFLHPSLAYLLGKAVATKAKATGKQLFVSTHSAHFVMGCIQSGAEVNVIRLTYTKNVPTARILPSANLTNLKQNPLLRSVGVLNGLFFDGVVVAESDTDRAFYNEINERLLLEGKGRGARNCLFLNAQNKQTVRVIVSLLRELGIPAAGIVDVDVIKDGGGVWGDFLRSGHVPEPLIGPFGQIRVAVKDALVATQKEMKRDGGVALLAGEQASSAATLFDSLDQYGLFVVRGGEVESWLKKLEVNGHGPSWLIPLFEKLGEDPSAANFVHADTDDVWQFIAGVASWLSDPKRKGMD